MYQTIHRLVTASRVWLYSYSISHVTQGKGGGWAPLGDVKIDLCLIASLHWHAIKNKKSRDHLIKTINVWITSPRFGLRSFSYCVTQLRNLSSKLIYLGIKTNIDNSIGTCLNFCRYEDKDLYCVVLVGQYGFRSYRGSSNSMQGRLGLNKVKTFCIPDLIFFSKLKKYIYFKISREEGCLPPLLVFVRLH